MLIVLKSYFDGGGEADSTQYDHLTLAAMVGRPKHWTAFNRAWKKVLGRHRIDWLHTTDAMSLKDVYKSWDQKLVDDLIDDCVTVIQQHSAPQRFGEGIRAITVTVVLKDLIRAFEENPHIGTAEENCVIPCFNAALIFGQKIGCSKFECYFDRGERFCGFLRDRMSNKASRKNDSILDAVIHIGESDMKLVPALQASDLFAWSVNDSHRVKTLRPWQRRLLVDTHRIGDLVDYASFKRDLIPSELERVRSWKMPRRGRPR